MKPVYGVTVVPLHSQPPRPPTPTVLPDVLQVPCPTEQQCPTRFKDPDAVLAEYQSSVESRKNSLFKEIMNYTSSPPLTAEKTKIMDLLLADLISNPIYAIPEPPLTILDTDMVSAPLLPSDFDLDMAVFFDSLSQSTSDFLANHQIPNSVASAPGGVWGSLGLTTLSDLTPSLTSTAGSSDSFQFLESEFSCLDGILGDLAPPTSTAESHPPPPLQLLTQDLGEVMVQDHPSAESPSTPLELSTQDSGDNMVQDLAATPLTPLPSEEA